MVTPTTKQRTKQTNKKKTQPIGTKQSVIVELGEEKKKKSKCKQKSIEQTNNLTKTKGIYDQSKQGERRVRKGRSVKRGARAREKKNET